MNVNETSQTHHSTYYSQFRSYSRSFDAFLWQLYRISKKVLKKVLERNRSSIEPRFKISRSISLALITCNDEWYTGKIQQKIIPFDTSEKKIMIERECIIFFQQKFQSDISIHSAAFRIAPMDFAETFFVYHYHQCLWFKITKDTIDTSFQQKI